VFACRHQISEPGLAILTQRCAMGSMLRQWWALVLRPLHERPAQTDGEPPPISDDEITPLARDRWSLLSHLRGDSEPAVGGMCRGAWGRVDQVLRRGSGRTAGGIARQGAAHRLSLSGDPPGIRRAAQTRRGGTGVRGDVSTRASTRTPGGRQVNVLRRPCPQRMSTRRKAKRDHVRYARCRATAPLRGSA
jgi:hypothetical protein